MDGPAATATCAVCLCKMNAAVERTLKLRCAHSFHAACLAPWACSGKNSCPMCRAPLHDVAVVYVTSHAVLAALPLHLIRTCVEAHRGMLRVVAWMMRAMDLSVFTNELRGMGFYLVTDDARTNAPVYCLIEDPTLAGDDLQCDSDDERDHSEAFAEYIEAQRDDFYDVAFY